MAESVGFNEREKAFLRGQTRDTALLALEVLIESNHLSAKAILSSHRDLVDLFQQGSQASITDEGLRAFVVTYARVMYGPERADFEASLVA